MATCRPLSTPQVNVKAADLSRRAQSVLGCLGEAWLQLLAPHVELLSEYRCELQRKGHGADELQRTPSVVPWLHSPARANSTSSKSSSARSEPATRSARFTSVPEVAAAMVDQGAPFAASAYLFTDLLLLCRDDLKAPAAYLLTPLERVTILPPQPSSSSDSLLGGGTSRGLPRPSTTLRDLPRPPAAFHDLPWPVLGLPQAPPSAVATAGAQRPTPATSPHSRAT